jgi:hypothetical protein
MGMALAAVDQGSDFNITEVTPAVFQGMTVAQLSGYDLIAINNKKSQIAGGLGANWHGAISGRIMLNSHDAPRFKMTFVNPPHNAFTMSLAGGNPGPGVEPFGADELVRQAALWVGGIPGRTGLLIFNDAARFWDPLDVGWNNWELGLPAAWGISDWDQSGGGFAPGGGYTSIVVPGLPVYSGAMPGGVPLSDVRFAVNTISSFAANVVDSSFHSIFATYNPVIFTPTEVVQNSGILDPGNYLIAESTTVSAPDGTAITLVHDIRKVGIDIKPGSCPNPLNVKSKGVTPVAIIGPTGVDPKTVTLEGVPALESPKPTLADVTKPFHDPGAVSPCYDCFDEEVEDPDGIPDLVVFFDTQELAGVPAIANAGDGDCVGLKLEGWIGPVGIGVPVEGKDAVIVKKKKGGKPAPSATTTLTTTWGEIKNK